VVQGDCLNLSDLITPRIIQPGWATKNLFTFRLFIHSFISIFHRSIRNFTFGLNATCSSKQFNSSSSLESWSTSTERKPGINPSAGAPTVPPVAPPAPVIAEIWKKTPYSGDFNPGMKLGNSIFIEKSPRSWQTWSVKEKLTGKSSLTLTLWNFNGTRHHESANWIQFQWLGQENGKLAQSVPANDASKPSTCCHREVRHISQSQFLRHRSQWGPSILATMTMTRRSFIFKLTAV